jgi:hypothetical protein
MRIRTEIERTASGLADERWQLWMACGVHPWQTLPRTDTGDYYCPNCCTIWTPDGAIRNIPERPTTQRR